MMIKIGQKQGHSSNFKLSSLTMKLMAVVTVAALAGCANQDKGLTVGSVSDDYRARHPIMITDKDMILDLPVGNFPTRMTHQAKDTISGFARDYMKSSAGQILVLQPMGASNSHKAGQYANLVANALASSGVPRHQIAVSSYETETEGGAAPVKVVYTALAASTGPCGVWNEDMLANTHTNTNYENFGCATQNNLAAQIANPLDLVAPRSMSQIDATRRANAIKSYQDNGAGL
ncbi:CpaD family pilus assembly protein [Lentilitoribacter sp. EG35]|jgi:pilus assembly protein CpaD